MAIRDRRSSDDVVAAQSGHLGVAVAVTAALGLVGLAALGNTEKLVPNVLDRFIAAPSPAT